MASASASFRRKSKTPSSVNVNTLDSTTGSDAGGSKPATPALTPGTTTMKSATKSKLSAAL